MRKYLKNWEEVIEQHRQSGKPILSVPEAPIVLKTKKFMISITNGFNEAQLKSVLKVIGELE